MQDTWVNGYAKDDLLKALGVLDTEWYIKGCPIPYNSDRDLWNRLDAVQGKVARLKIKQPVIKFEPPRFHVISDEMTGGVFCPADGKTYDSKSSYYKAVKAKGLEIVGNDAPMKRATPKTNDINWEKAVAETLKQTPLTKKKGR